MNKKERPNLLSKSLIEAVAENKNTIFGEIMLGSNHLEKVVTRNMLNNKKKSTHDTDYIVKSCPECKLSWERVKISSSKKRKRIIYYKNFPKYGKEVEVCDRCNEEEN